MDWSDWDPGAVEHPDLGTLRARVLGSQPVAAPVFDVEIVFVDTLEDEE